jgi:hypothetical protein
LGLAVGYAFRLGVARFERGLDQIDARVLLAMAARDLLREGFDQRSG